MYTHVYSCITVVASNANNLSAKFSNGYKHKTRSQINSVEWNFYARTIFAF